MQYQLSQNSDNACLVECDALKVNAFERQSVKFIPIQSLDNVFFNLRYQRQIEQNSG